MMYGLLFINPLFFRIPVSYEIHGIITRIATLMGVSFYLLNYFFFPLWPGTIIGGTIIVAEMVPTNARASGQFFNVFIERIAGGFSFQDFQQCFRLLS